jgi:hypothetical protein
MARWITFLIFGGGGLGLLYVGVTQYLLQRRLMAHAIPIEVEIIKSEVFTSGSADTDRRLDRNTSTTTYRPDIRFRYAHGGQKYESDLLRPTIIVQGYASRESAAKELASFPLGAKVPAFVDPQHPDKAYLKQEEFAGPLVFMILGVILPPLAWIVGKYI